MPQKDLTAERLSTRIKELAADPAILAQAAGAALTAGRPDATSKLADVIDGLCEPGRESAILTDTPGRAEG